MRGRENMRGERGGKFGDEEMDYVERRLTQRDRIWLALMT